VPPAITVTDHDDRIRTEDDDDSDADTSPSSSEDDYPDQVIEAPSAPSIPYDEVEKEQAQQEAFGKTVLLQIQAFGESANDEFDVQWTHDNLFPNETRENIFADDESTTPAATISISLPIETQIADRPPTENAVVSDRKNPFIEVESSDISLQITEDMSKSLKSEEVDYAAAAIYDSNQQYFIHRPGPVYTIPEDEEQDDGEVNTDSKFYGTAKEIPRRVHIKPNVSKLTPEFASLWGITSSSSTVLTGNVAHKG
ncbi:unnamed protein product, partial [Thelazia callipaeda]|uniref:Ig-like domain-containing protein n=1 Tax=Thelazia callipaeda TaxID=103827 RepID=A0A0N5CL81_THECL